MKRILLVTESIPYPPLNGKEITTAKIFEVLSKHFIVDIIVLSQDKTDYEDRVGNLPTNFRDSYFLPITPSGRLKSIFKELFLVQPLFFSYSFPLEEAKKLTYDYDYVWAGPIGCYQFVRKMRKEGITVGKKTGIGLADVISKAYGNAWNELKSGRYGLSSIRLNHTLRAPLIALHEKKYLSEVDFVHLQTYNEERKLIQLMSGTKHIPKVITACNAIKPELLNIQYNPDSNNVLFLTSLSSQRDSESKWFIKKVWPTVYKKHPHLKLILVGSPPKSNSWLYNKQYPGVIINGFAEKFENAFKDRLCIVIPILHNAGIINRALDGLSAGMPVIATPQVLGTIDGSNNTNTILASTIEEYESAFDLLVNNRDKTISIAENGRELGKSFLSWEESGEKIASQMLDLDR